MYNHTYIEGLEKLPFYLTIEIKTDIEKDCKYVIIHSSIHKNKSKVMTWCYSLEFTDTQILSDNLLVPYIKGYL